MTCSTSALPLTRQITMSSTGVVDFPSDAFQNGQVDMSFLESLHDAPINNHRENRASRPALFNHLFTEFKAYYDFLASIGRLDLFSVAETIAPQTPETMLSVHTFGITFTTLVGFLRFYCAGTFGQLSDYVSVTSMLRVLIDFRSLWQHRTHTSLDPEISLAATRYISNTIKHDFGLIDQKRVVAWADDHDLDKIARAYLNPSFKAKTTRSRWQQLFWFSATTISAARIGSMLRFSASSTTTRTLTWSDIELHVLRVPDSDNKLAIKITCPNAKTKDAQGLELDFATEDAVGWKDPTLYLLVIAHHCGALLDGWDIDRLLDPVIFLPEGLAAGQSSLVLSFNPEMKDHFVFTRDYEVVDAVDHWCTDVPRHMLINACDFLGYDKPLLPHGLRRARGIKFKLAG